MSDMNTKEIVPGGPSREETTELNRPKPRSNSKAGEKLMNVAATGTAAFLGGTLAEQVHQVVNNPPPQIRENSLPQPKPPAGVVFPQSPRADAPATEQKPHRVFIPLVNKEYRENPYLTREFGAPERGVIMRNKVEQGGGNPAWVEMGDQELFENMMYLRETYGRPDLKLEITFYSSVNLLLRDPNAPPWRTENLRGVLNYDSWAGGSGTFQNGSILFRYDEDQKTLRFYITLPETYPGRIPTEGEVHRIIPFFLNSIRGKFLSGENGYQNSSPSYQDLKDYPTYILEEPVLGSRVTRATLWIKLETIPVYGGKSVDNNK